MHAAENGSDLLHDAPAYLARFACRVIRGEATGSQLLRLSTCCDPTITAALINEYDFHREFVVFVPSSRKRDFVARPVALGITLATDRSRASPRLQKEPESRKSSIFARSPPSTKVSSHDLHFDWRIFRVEDSSKFFEKDCVNFDSLQINSVNSKG